jgi:hypothetical protein
MALHPRDTVNAGMNDEETLPDASANPPFLVPIRQFRGAAA